ncbi:MAG TPA: hypothetical protein VJS63_04125 [Bradyrhizobium sp.]|nr:hypothetical protein [Bradyrhizobium sp.]
MRSSTAYFAGAGTVIVAIAAGLGGGLVISSIVSPHQEKYGSVELTRLERRKSPEPIPAATSAQLEPVPYLAPPQVSAAVADNPPPSQPQPVSQQPQQAAQQPPPVQQQTSAPQPATQAAAAPIAPPPAAQPAPEESFAKARDADAKPDMRRAEERRRAERRQQWTERRKLRPRDGDDLREVERAVREDTEPRARESFARERESFPRERESLTAEPVRMELPRIRLFDPE